ncbi:MAG TPA: HlyD family secretion protein [Dongiaceae bacterium]|jgi:membrane fusion protein (multidrug efflux system)|nr:HlyD family secretion protein [Dongiaceae bacterium]
MPEGDHSLERREPSFGDPETAQESSRAAEPPKPQPAPRPWRPASGRPRRRLMIRAALFLLLPLALVVGGYYYVTGGQVMSTDNAYVEANRVGISTDVAGTVISIEVKNNEVVKKGQVLYRLKPDSFKIALAGAEAQLGTVRNQILTLKASYSQALAQIAQAQADVPYYQAQFQRQADLKSSAAYNKAAYDKAQNDLTAAQQKVNVAKAQAAAMLAQLGNDADQPVEENPFYLQAQAAVDDARRDLNDTVVKAPFDGVATNVPALQVGQYLKSGQQAFSLVSTTDIWVEASPKETELTYVQPGQPVTVTVDTYPDVEWHGVVSSISPASGSSFSMLPAQNTTGNWVKVVQRIPMIVSFTDLAGKPQLRVGMSVVVSVDTGHTRGLPTMISKLFERSSNTRG